ncbi:GDSL-type esterase/lipase family protein [bacterium]|nr:GDSL-type esterase/lipase family protein [bacterium]
MLRHGFGKLLLGVALGVMLCQSGLSGQQERFERWEKDIRGLEARSRENGFPAPGVIVFTGSSSVHGWDSLEQDMAPLKVINCGFGGSQIDEATYFANRIVIPYMPSRVVIYSGDNDIASGKSPETVAADFRAFVERLRASIPGEPVYFLSIKPSTARWKLWDKIQKANALIRGYCEGEKRVFYVDVATTLLGPDGKPDVSLYQEDGLHLNADGYARWTAIVKPLLSEPLPGDGQ